MLYVCVYIIHIHSSNNKQIAKAAMRRNTYSLELSDCVDWLALLLPECQPTTARLRDRGEPVIIGECHVDSAMQSESAETDILL